MELDSLAPSHIPSRGFQPNPRYALENERRYHDEPASQAKVLETAHNLDPDLLMEAPDANQGAPVVDHEGNVLGGNGRTMALAEAYEKGMPGAQSYRAELLARAPALGIDPAAVEGMRQPVLVRRTTPLPLEARQQLVGDLNREFTHARDARADSKSRGDRFSRGTLEALGSSLRDVDTLRELFDSASSRRLVDMLVRDGVIQETERNAYLAADGTLNPEGKTVVERALRGRVAESYEDLARLPAAVVAKIDAITPHVLVAEAAGPEWSVTPDIKGAVRLAAEYQGSGAETPVTFLDRLALDGSGTPRERFSPSAVELFQALLGANKKQLVAAFAKYAGAAKLATGGALPGLSKEPARAFEESFGRRGRGGPLPDVSLLPTGRGSNRRAKGPTEARDEIRRGLAADEPPVQEPPGSGDQPPPRETGTYLPPLNPLEGAPALDSPGLVSLAGALFGKHRIRILEHMPRESKESSGIFNPSPKNPYIGLDWGIFYGKPVARETFSLNTKRAEIDAWAKEAAELLDIPESIVQWRGHRDGKENLVTLYQRDPEYAWRVLAHEIGHATDFFPDQVVRGRGNILGHIAALRKFYKDRLEAFPGAPGDLTDTDLAALRSEAERLTQGRDYEIQVDEEIERLVGVTPDDILAVWNNLIPKDQLPAGLYDTIAAMDAPQKKAMILAAMKGLVPDELRHLARVIKEKTGRVITKTIHEPPSEKEIRQKFKDLVQQEVARRGLYELRTINAELQDLTRWWKPFDVTMDRAFTRYRFSPAELYADALSVLLNAPTELASRAPTFYRAFGMWLQVRPDFAKAYEGILNGIAQGTHPEQVWAKVRDGFASADMVHAEKWSRKPQIMTAVEQLFIDKYFPVYKVLSGHTLDYTRGAIENAAYSGSTQRHYAHRMYREVQLAFEPLMSHVDFGILLTNSRIVGERATIANPFGIAPKQAQEWLDKTRDAFGPQRWGEVMAIKQRFWEINRDCVVSLMEESGMHSEAIILKSKTNQDYATFEVFERLLDEKFGDGHVSSQIYAQHGTFSAITNPYTATVMKGLAMIPAMKWNMAKEALHSALPADMVQEPQWTFDKEGRRLPVKPPASSDKGLVVYMKDGKLKAFYTDKWIARAFNYTPDDGLSIISGLAGRFLGTPARAWFTTFSLGFQLTNLPRDAQRYMRQLPGYGWRRDARALWHYFKAIGPAFAKEFGLPPDFVQQMEKDGAFVSWANMLAGYDKMPGEIDRQMAKYGVYDLAKVNKGDPPPYALTPWQAARDMTGKLFDRAMDLVQGVTGALESIPKIAAMTYMNEQHPEMAKQTKLDIVRGEVGSPPFAVKGTATPLVSSIFLFLNPAIQGPRYDYRSYKRDPKAWRINMLKSAVLPRILMFAAAVGLYGDDVRRLMQKMNPYDLLNYYCVPLGETKDGQAVYLRLPQDESVRMLGGMLWIALNWAARQASGGRAGQTPRAGDLASLLDFAGGQVPNINPVFTLLANTMDLASGQNPVDARSGRPIIDETIFKAGGVQKWIEFAKYSANAMGGSKVYKFETGSSGPRELSSEVANLVRMPILSDTLGRFLKTSDQGEYNELKAAGDQVQRQRAKDTLSAREAAQALLNNEPLTSEQLVGLVKKGNKADDIIVRSALRRYGDAVVRAYTEAQSNEEKLAILQRYAQITGPLGQVVDPPKGLLVK